MKIADLYIRVSTDEQADKGYSQRSQEELLVKYCEINKITVRKIIFEDHSAKTFARPAWKNYLLDAKSKNRQSNLLLFLKWDRFSRNAADAYQMIKILRDLGIEPQAIEQPLDLSVPENKMMLAFYLAAPEVENDRRALNVVNGMRRASKEGRYMCKAPFGYLNRTREDGRKHIVIDEHAAKIVRWIYRKIVEGIFNTNQIYKLAQEKGLTTSRSTFFDLIRNPTYCGKILVKKYKDESSQLVKGQHEPILSEALYLEAQDTLDGRTKSNYKAKAYTNDEMALRGFLICPKCGKLLTGSASKGRSKYYSYYHCTMRCPTRVSSQIINEAFEKELDKFTVIDSPSLLDAFEILLLDTWNEKTNHLRLDRKQLTDQIKILEGKLSHIRDLLSSKQLDPGDFKEMKAEYSSDLERLEVKLSGADEEQTNIKPLINKGLKNLLNLRLVYQKGGIEKKRQIIGSIFPEKLTFEEGALRTTRINEVVECIYLINSNLQQNKKRTSENNFVLSAYEPPAGIEPATY